VKIFPKTVKFEEALAVDIGREGDAALIQSGWFDREPAGGGTRVRWTSPHATLRLPLAPKEGGYQLLVYARRGRPADHPAAATFKINGQSLQEESVQVDAVHGLETYRLIVPSGTLNSGWGNRLDVTSAPWIPGDVGGQIDRRPLGLMIDRIELKPMS
jgi:hypothetical protein